MVNATSFGVWQFGVQVPVLFLTMSVIWEIIYVSELQFDHMYHEDITTLMGWLNVAIYIKS